jgi:transposase
MAASLKVTEADRAMLESWLRAPTLAQGLALLARVILASADGEGVRPMARRLAKEVKLSPATVHRIWQKYGLQPHRVERFKFSRDPEFDGKLADIVGLYLDPPERALVLCVDEKSQIQALNRTQPALPIWPGLPARMTHDYTRHGTTSLFATLEVASGKVHGRCFKRHPHVEFIAFLESLTKRYPRLELHLICDHYGTHKHPAVAHWLAAHPRFQLHFTPTSASWLNLIERWFALITSQAIRRGSFDSVRRLERAITRWLTHWNETAKPFRWTRSAAEIKRSIANVTAIYDS